MPATARFLAPIDCVKIPALKRRAVWVDGERVRKVTLHTTGGGGGGGGQRYVSSINNLSPPPHPYRPLDGTIKKSTMSN